MTSCPNCKKEFEEKTGRRPKRFCSENCKDTFWNFQKRIAAKDVAPKKVQDLSKPNTEVKPVEQPKTNYVVDTRKPFMSEAIKKKLGL